MRQTPINSLQQEKKGPQFAKVGLDLEQVYGAIAFYLDNKEAAEKDIEERDREEREFVNPYPPPPELIAKLQRAREQMLARRT